MNCKFCNAELPEEVTLCPECGKENLEEVVEAATEEVIEETAEVTSEEAVEETAEETSEEATEEITEVASEEEAPAEKTKPKPKLWMIILAIIGAAALVTVLISAVVYGIRNADKPVATYTVSDEEAVKARDVVVATVGTEELTNSELQVFFWQGVNEFYNYYGYYMDMSTMGLDLEKPLDQQFYNEEEGITWQKYFLDSALTTWSRYAALIMAAKEAKYDLPAEAQEYLDDIPQQLEELAVSYGYATGADLLKADMSPACDVNGYVKFLRTNLYAGEYMDTLSDSLIPTMDEIEAYYEENAETLNAQGIVKDNSVSVDVRHILICPTGGTENDDGSVTYSEAEWEACRVKAQDLYDQWLADGTEDGFATLAGQYTEDPGSMSTGGLYTEVQQGDMVAPFDAWCFDASRKYGDSGLVQTDYGYHLMFFVAAEQTWVANVQNTIINEKSTEIVDNAVAKWPMEVNDKKLALGAVASAVE